MGRSVGCRGFGVIGFLSDFWVDRFVAEVEGAESAPLRGTGGCLYCLWDGYSRGYSSDSLSPWDVITPNIIIADRFAYEIMTILNADAIL
jgi:hypothetical protein